MNSPGTTSSTISACTLDCPDGCSFLADPHTRTIRPNPDHPFTGNLICRKGARFFERLDAPERILQPMIRKRRKTGRLQAGHGGRGFEPVSWDVALDLIASRLNSLRDRPDAVLHVRGYGYRGVLAQASLNFFAALGSSTIHGSLCDEAGIEACLRDFGALDHNDPIDLLKAARIVNWGKDLGRSSLHTALLVRRARSSGVRVLTVSPGGDGSGAFSDKILRIRPGTDRFLAAWVMRGLLELDAVTADVPRAALDWPRFRELVLSLDPEELLRVCDVNPDDARELLEWYAAAGPTASLIGWGLQRHVFGGQNVRFINALAVLSGNIGRSGGGAYFNIASGRNLGQWSASSPGRAVDAEARRSFLLPSLAWDLEWADPSVEFVWVDGHNVVNQVPDSLAMAKALERPFTVCVDAFWNDTAQCADVVLPPALMLEREEILGSCLHDYVNYSGRAVSARGECRSDFDILRDLGARLEPPVVFPEVEECLRIGLSPLDMDLDTFRSRGFAKAEHPEVAFAGMRFAHPDGLYRFPDSLDTEPDEDDEYSLRLLSLVRGKYMHSQIPEAEQQGLPRIWVSPDNPDLSELDKDAEIFLATPLGRMSVTVGIDETLHPLAVIIRRDGWVSLGHGPNAIIEIRETDMGNCAAYYSQCCRLETEGGG
ncbi:molybdopterin-dependent oxidoreductase [Desulfonatronum parangueonense]